MNLAFLFVSIVTGAIAGRMAVHLPAPLLKKHVLGTGIFSKWRYFGASGTLLGLICSMVAVGLALGPIFISKRLYLLLYPYIAFWLVAAGLSHDVTVWSKRAA